MPNLDDIMKMAQDAQAELQKAQASLDLLATRRPPAPAEAAYTIVVQR